MYDEKFNNSFIINFVVHNQTYTVYNTYKYNITKTKSNDCSLLNF